MSAPPVALRRLDLSAADADPAVAAEIQALLRRGAVPDQRVREGARAILASVKAGGDAAVREANGRFGGGRADGSLLVGRAEMEAARDALAPRIRAGLEQMIENIRRFAETQRPHTRVTMIIPGVEIERRWSPLARVGVYAPGGSAAYPSSLLMGVVPARVAGVGTVVVASPADAVGGLNRTLLGAAALVGVDVFIVAGGAQAVGAMAYGLPELGVAPVDRIVGPGNSWVTAAKLEVFGECGIDLPAGPSEVMVVADATADPVHVAADMLSQAEHGPDSPALLVTWDAAFAAAVEVELGRQLATAARREILERSLAKGALIVLAPDRDAALAFVNGYAPEHLSLSWTTSRRPSRGCLTRARCSSAPTRPSPPATMPPEPTTSCRPAAWPAPAAPCRPRTTASSCRSSGSAATAWRPSATRSKSIAEAEGLIAHKRAVELRFEARP